jgi:hypothetical protein
MNALFSFDLFMVYIPECKQKLRTMKYCISVFFSRVPNFHFIRGSHGSAKMRIRINFHPLLHQYLYFLK